ncbi:sorting nexin-22 isoform X1 [Salvelinus fontinalis]|uniref:sorting nexin-22 isoform X1 n=1 Tax=Salvelinus fontinalis TaxID=8038 RepID=UPI002485ED24|nr:sorting nexin-22 isoform X1 [Salvelinus fontinalis]
MAEDSPMIEVSIPSLEREVDESGKLRKLFRVEILFNGRKHFVLRRHSEFQTLHRKLKKILHPPDFPSKRSTHLRTKPLEQRRQQLEDYIQDIIYQYEEVPQVLLDFLHVKHFHSGNKISSLEYVPACLPLCPHLNQLLTSDHLMIVTLRDMAVSCSISVWWDSVVTPISWRPPQICQTSSWMGSCRACTPETSVSASQPAQNPASQRDPVWLQVQPVPSKLQHFPLYSGSSCRSPDTRICGF